MGPDGFEPSTNGLKGRCSTVELRSLNWKHFIMISRLVKVFLREKKSLTTWFFYGKGGRGAPPYPPHEKNPFSGFSYCDLVMKAEQMFILIQTNLLQFVRDSRIIF